MTRRGWALFAAMCLVWGVPYLLIKVAVDAGLAAPVVVAGRCLVGAVLLLPFGLRREPVRLLLRHWRALVAYSALELAGPWLMLTDAETRISSSLAALLLAATPVVAAVATTLLGDERLGRRRVGGLVLGAVGVAALVGIDLGSVDARAVVEVLLTATGYALGPMVVARRLRGVPTMTVIVASLLLTGLLYLPLALAQRPAHLPAHAVEAVLALGVVCTALAFVLFFALIAEVGAARAPVITYVNPAVALVLGVVLLDEPLTLGICLGFPLVVLGSVLATSRSAPRGDGAAAAPEPAAEGAAAPGVPGAATRDVPA
ncbi:drug/metabolite transporter (DMT)-like permease [Motilibacter rhizosphaerae]|uniref:Drug/metabolite transporter (DMT)-like permease n=1 Tax=Motilibacter rhizosphaerae TaxID=598652 RepID=A0A4Q7NPS4_9ACTN|nr:DMT family transporter [Motilibacter rhizosphaerae]RZS87279.1 drug/metabolite transporter (DMT)-like permease [Motilibacter rhizosphaerae]